MIARAIEDVIVNFEEIVKDIVIESHIELIITRPSKYTVVLMSESDLKSVYETIEMDVQVIQYSTEIDSGTIVDFTNQLDHLMIEADDETVKLAIRKAGLETVVMMFEAEYNSLIETAYLSRNPETRCKILRNIEEMKNCEGLIKELIYED